MTSSVEGKGGSVEGKGGSVEAIKGVAAWIWWL